ncbi:MAG TPA: hypothetical protein VE955_07260 [Candidatus Dormibacteraeota bacterium]|jgi:hypothetical protein|nr:hypothetical protein [Candidatus Dormibacteraeota bacterium]
MTILKRARLVDFARDERVRVQDLEKLRDSQLAQQSQILGFLAGVVFGGLLAAAVTKGIDLVMIFNIFTEPIPEAVLIAFVALGLGLATFIAFSATSMVGFRFKVNLMKDFLEARRIVESRQQTKLS